MIIGFKSQANLLSRMFFYLQSGKISTPIYTLEQAQPGTSNREFISRYTAELLHSAFPNLKDNQISHFVQGLFSLNEDTNKFKTHLRDFLISLKEFQGDDNADLYAEEREQEKAEREQGERERQLKVGGLIKPSELEGDDEL